MAKDKIVAQVVRQEMMRELKDILSHSQSTENSLSENSISVGNFALYHLRNIDAALTNAVIDLDIYIPNINLPDVQAARAFINDVNNVVEVKESGGGILSIITAIFCCACIFGVSNSEKGPSFSGKNGFNDDGFNDGGDGSATA